MGRPSFTKKHYEAVARALAEARGAGNGGDDWASGVRYGIDEATEALADIFAADNERFDRFRFENAARAKTRSIFTVSGE